MKPTIIENFYEYYEIDQLVDTKNISTFCSNLTPYNYIKGQLYIQFANEATPQLRFINGYVHFEKYKAKFILKFIIKNENHCLINGKKQPKDKTFIINDIPPLMSTLSKHEGGYDLIEEINHLINNQYHRSIIKFYFSESDILEECKKFGISTKTDLINLEAITSTPTQKTSAQNMVLMSNIINHLNELTNNTDNTYLIADVLSAMQKQGFDLFEGLELDSKEIGKRFKNFVKANIENINSISKVTAQNYIYSDDMLSAKNVHKALRRQINNAVDRLK